MSDMLIRDVPEAVIAALDERSRRLGLSRSEYVRRVLGRERRGQGTFEVSDLAEFEDRIHDLADDEVMEAAWR